LESRLRAELERELAERRQAMSAEADGARVQSEAELGRLRRELQQKDSSWGERLLAKESELITQRSRADELSGKLSNEEAARTAALRDKLEVERQLEGLREQLGAQQASLRAFQDRLATAEAEKSRLEMEKTELERLSTAQAAQVQGSQEALEATRLQLARETQTGKILQNAREQAEKSLAAQRAEVTRSLNAHKAELDHVHAVERDRADAAIAKALQERDAAVSAAAAAAAKAAAEADDRIERARAQAAEQAVRAAADVEAVLGAARAEIADLSRKLEEARHESWTKKLFHKENDGDKAA
ncbi:MAG: hypothetical protein Q7J64_01225, partial [Elusimicrobiota bacterium]|nr:hypothetical protein [Elusimicrobiota bacterium]